MRRQEYPEALLDRPSSRYHYLRWQAESFVLLWCRANGQLPRESDVHKTINALENGLLSWGPSLADMSVWRSNVAFELRAHEPQSLWQPAMIWQHFRLSASLATQQLRIFWRHGCVDLNGAAIRSWLRPTSKPEIHWRGQVPPCCFTTLIEERPARISDSLMFCRYCHGDLHYHHGAWEKLPLPPPPKDGPELSYDERGNLEKQRFEIEKKITVLLSHKPMTEETLERVLSLKQRKIIIGTHRYNSLGHYLDEVPTITTPIKA